MATVFWDQQGVILVEFMPKETTINSEAYVNTEKAKEQTSSLQTKS